MSIETVSHEYGKTAGPDVSGPSSLPLAGVRVVDLSQIAAGPYGTSLLGDLGADVIKVEPPEGDSFRDLDDAFGAGQSGYFFGVNRSKRSIALDLKSAGGYAVLTRLIRTADVVVVAFRPGALKRLRIDYDTLRELNPRLVYASITAFGEAGPRADQPGMDILAQALSGMMGMTGEAGRGPVKVGAPIADFIASFLTGYGVCAALLLRERTGVGDKISVSLTDGLLAAFANYLTVYDKLRVSFRRQGGSHPQIVPYQPFLGSDGKYFILACLNDKFWQMLLPMLDEYGDFREDRFLTNIGRIEHRDELCGRLQAIFGQRPAGYWLERLEASGVPCGPINELEDALADPQVLANEAVTHLEHPVHGRYLVPNNPIRFTAAPTGPRGYAPGLGEHTAQILGELGYPAEEVERLFSTGAVRSVDHDPPVRGETPARRNSDLTSEFTAVAQPVSLTGDQQVAVPMVHARTAGSNGRGHQDENPDR
jgi:crotonobetainyl-CoA:carnitine CoA-transferase CaiB-like acyl-CoA transferase